jgi:hypothetical protein
LLDPSPRATAVAPPATASTAITAPAMSAGRGPREEGRGGPGRRGPGPYWVGAGRTCAGGRQSGRGPDPGSAA